MHNHSMKYQTTAPQSVSQAKLPALKRGAFTAPKITESWFSSIAETAGEKHAQDTAILKAKFMHQGLINALDGFERLRDNRSPNVTPAAHLQTIQKAGEKLIESTAKQFDQARAEINYRRQQVGNEIKQRLGLDVNAKQNEEIRAILRSMPEKKRIEAISQAVESGDPTIISALWESHPIAIGVSAELLNSYRESAKNKHARDLVHLKAALDKSEDLLLSSFDQTIELSQQAIGGGEAIEKFKQQAQKADEALAGFNSLVG